MILVEVIDQASLILPCLMRCSKSLLKNKEQSREPKATVYPWSCNRKTKPRILHWSFKISFILFVNTLFTNQHSSLRIKPQTLTLILLDFFQKIEPILIMESAILWGEYIGILLVLSRIAIFFIDKSKGKLMACHRTCHRTASSNA